MPFQKRLTILRTHLWLEMLQSRSLLFFTYLSNGTPVLLKLNHTLHGEHFNNKLFIMEMESMILSQGKIFPVYFARLESTYNTMPMTQPQTSSLECNRVGGPLFYNSVAPYKEGPVCPTSTIAAKFPYTDKATTFQGKSMYSCKGRNTRRSRLPPRRPLYLSDQSNFLDKCGNDHGGVSVPQKTSSLCQIPSEAKYGEGTSGGVNWPGYTTEQKIVYQHMLTDGHNKKIETPTNINLNFTMKDDAVNIEFQKQLLDSKLITEELVWTEELLSNFDNLREEIFQKETELSGLREGHKSGDPEEYNAERARYLEQKIIALHQRKSLLFPTIQVLANRAGALHRMLSNTGSQVLHLD